MRGYFKVDGRWTRYTLAFMHYFDWNRRINEGRGCTKAPRNYHVWPIFESVKPLDTVR